MKHYAGLDISMKETFICIMDQQGTVVHKGKCKTDPEEIFQHLNASQYQLEKVGLESGSLSGYITKSLREKGIAAICIDARKMAAVLSVRINKTDANDAEGIAEAMRCNLYREVMLKTKEELQISIILKTRRTALEQRTEIINTIRGLLKNYGVTLPGRGMTSFASRVRDCYRNQQITAQDGVESLLKIFEIQSEEIKRLDRIVEEIARNDREVKRLMTTPGVGVITALNFKVTISNPKRFKNSRKVGAYLGMTPRQYSSGERIKQGGVSKCGPKEMRCLLMEAALVLLTRSKKWSKLKVWGLKIMRKKGAKKAMMAVGRKLAVIMHRMLMDGTDFIFGEEKEQKTRSKQRRKPMQNAGAA
jgi:transposase